MMRKNDSSLKDINSSRSWVEVVKKLMKEEKKEWDALPNTALLKIFCKSELKDRLESIPLVCKSWKNVTDDPRCWSSMIPDSVSPEDAFIKKRAGYTLSDCFLSYKFEEEKEVEEVLVDLSRLLRTLIKKSGGGAAITTLYLGPFTPFQLPFNRDDIDETYDEILHLIANCCPNLKHISFKVYHSTSMEAVILFFNKCKKLELIELFMGRFTDEVPPYLKLLESLSCLPDLHGVHFYYYYGGFKAVSTTIVTHLPGLKLLRLDCEPLNDEHLSIILLSCLELQYLYVIVNWQLYYNNQDIIDQASVQIPEFYYQRGYRSYAESDEENYLVLDDYSDSCFEDHGSNETDAFPIDDNFHIDDDFLIDDYRDILMQRKEDHYVSILKEKIKTKKTNYTSKKNKKYQYAYSDYVIQLK